MKISFNDLDKDVQKPLNAIRSLMASYKPSDKNADIGFDGTGFTIKRENSSISDPICTRIELEEMKKHFYHNDNIYDSSFHVDYVGNRITRATRRFKNKLQAETVVKTAGSAKLYLISDFKDAFAVLTETGKLAKFAKDTGKLQSQIDLLHELKSKFNLQTITIYNIQDIALCESGLFIATDLYGIFYFDFAKKMIERKFKELYTNKLKYIGDGAILCLTKQYIALYHIDVDSRIERYIGLAQNGQKPKDICMSGNHIFILGKSFAGVGSDELIHGWTRSGPTILNNITNQIAKHKDAVHYSAKFIDIIGKYLFIFGQVGTQMFAWKYQLDNLRQSPNEIIFDGPIGDLRYCRIYQGNFIYGDGERVYLAHEDGEVYEHYYSENIINQIISDENNLYAVSDTSVSRITFPTYEGLDSNTFELIKDGNYNDVGILVLGLTHRDHFSLMINNDKNNSYKHVFVDDGLYIHIPYPVFNLSMDVKVNSKNVLRGIIVRKNQIYN